jgi:hypothetical protein
MTYDRYHEDTPAFPKPYAFVPLSRGRVQKQKPAGHASYQAKLLTGTLSAQMIVRSPVHVASGLLEPRRDHKNPLVKAHFRTQGKLAIPGSSLKGCIRSIVEAITPSAVQVSRARLPRDYQPSRDTDKLDSAQRLFGAMGYQGAVQVYDALQEEGRMEIIPTPQLFSPRSSAVNTYYDGETPKGRKFYMHGNLATGDTPLEACAVNSRLPLRIQFANLTAGEVGLLLIALGVGEPRFCPKLGGSKPSCLGTIEVQEPSVETVDYRAQYSDFDAGMQPHEIAPLLAAAKAEELVLQTQLQQLAETLRWPRDDRQCPTGTY